MKLSINFLISIAATLVFAALVTAMLNKSSFPTGVAHELTLVSWPMPDRSLTVAHVREDGIVIIPFCNAIYKHRVSISPDLIEQQATENLANVIAHLSNMEVVGLNEASMMISIPILYELQQDDVMPKHTWLQKFWCTKVSVEQFIDKVPPKSETP